MGEKVSIYRYFEGLKEYLESKNIKIREKDEIEFEKAVGEVKRLENKKGILLVKHRKFALSKRKTEEEFDLKEIDVPSLPEFIEGYILDRNPLVVERLKRGEFSAQATLDLHGLTLKEAKEAFLNFIEESTKKGLRCVKIIHGRGLRSKTEPTIKKALKGWLIMAKQRKWIYAFASARMNEGGPGATLILLKRKPSKEKIEIMG